MSDMSKKFITINHELCRACKACESACPTGAISWGLREFGGNYDWLNCTCCGACIEACPESARSWQGLPAAQWDDRSIRYFAQPGPQNTMHVIDAVKERLEIGDITTVVCGSASGSSATLMADAGLSHGIKLINVSIPAITDKGRFELAKRGIKFLELATDWSSLSPMTCYSSNIPQTFEISDAGLALYEGLITVGGMGLRVAVLCVLDACLQEEIQIGERVIGVAGTSFGFDTAAVIHATTPDAIFGPDPARRLTLEEIIAMPRLPRRYQ